MKNLRIVVIAGLMSWVFLSACNEEVIEARKTTYFFTKIDPADKMLNLSIDGYQIGPLNYVKDGIMSFSDRKDGLMYTFPENNMKVVVSDEWGNIIAEGTIGFRKNGREFSVDNLNGKENLVLTIYQGDTDNTDTGVIIEVKE